MKYIMLIALFFNLNTHAKNLGHLLTGTAQTFKKNETSVGSTIIGHGLTDNLIVGISPFAFFSYNFMNFIVRYKVYEGHSVSTAFDFYYFDSLDKSEGSISNFDQTSWFFKSNTEIKISESTKVMATVGYQYFIRENSTYSFRSDPLGKYFSFLAKLYDDYEMKLEDYALIERDPRTISLSFILNQYLTDSLFLNFELGLLGVNYLVPLKHVGFSIYYESQEWTLGIGVSKSSRITKYLEEVIYHPEASFHYYF